MAKRRMFSLDIIDTDMFLDMSVGSQNLYFHLAMRADDDGFVASPKKILKITNATQNDYDILIAKQFVIPFETGVCVIKHWKIHNLVRSDRYKKTMYDQEMACIKQDNNGVYRLDTKWQPNDNQMEPQDRLGKDRLGKDRLVLSCQKDDEIHSNFQTLLNLINEKTGKKYRKTTGRINKYKARLKTFSFDEILTATSNMFENEWYRGGNSSNWSASPDFILRNDEMIDKFLNYKHKDNSDNELLVLNEV